MGATNGNAELSNSDSTTAKQPGLISQLFSKRKRMEEFTMMEELVDIINQLQDVFAAGVSTEIDLPQIVVVGSQSAGKSSVLEQIVGKSFLPRGTGIVTRCPLVLQLVHAPEKTGEYATFQHDSEKIFTDYNLIRQEIENQTDKLAGARKDVCHTSINLKIYSPSLLDLTLVDLPGLMKVPIENQPANIEEQTRSLIMKYITNPKSIILAVSPANADMATSDSLKIAKEVDPQGTRTLAVLTKIDLMDKGTDAWDMLLGKVIPVKLGIIGVVNRSQQDINEDKSIKDHLEKEVDFFEKNYERIAAFHGSPYLARTVQSILVRHIKNCMPDLKKTISQKLETNKKELSRYAKSGLDNQTLLLSLIFKFTNIYSSSLKGDLVNNIHAGNLVGGARVHAVFKESFAEDLNNIDPLHSLQKDTILIAINNSNGMKPELFFPVAVFERFAQSQVQQFRQPSLRCVESVHEELSKIAQSCIENESLQLEHYPKLRIAFGDVVTELLESRLPITKQTVESFIDIQTSHINTTHPDFLLKHATVERAYQDIHNKTTTFLSLKLPFDNPNVINRDKDSVNCALMQECIKTYMSIERKIIEDTVPKIIIHFMVNVVVEQLHRQLVEKLFEKGNHEDLLNESVESTKRRDVIEADIAKLEKAKTIINTISTKSHKIMKF